MISNRRRLPWLMLLGYIALSLAALPLALPFWNAFLRGSAGRFMSAEQFHLVQYGVLGLLARWVASAEGGGRQILSAEGPRRANLPALLGAVALAGLADEGVQALLPQRYFQWSDVALNWAGGLLGFGLGWRLRGIARWMLRRAAPSRAP